MDKAQYLINELRDENPDVVFFDNMDSALIGSGRIGRADPVAVYSKTKIYDKLFADGMSREDADEYFLGKFVALWAGEHTPVIFDDIPAE